MLCKIHISQYFPGIPFEYSRAQKNKEFVVVCRIVDLLIWLLLPQAWFLLYRSIERWQLS